MKMKIIRNVEKGITDQKIYHNHTGEWQVSEYGREFTGHTNGEKAELFSMVGKITLSYGVHQRDFNFGKDLYSIPMEELINEMKSRVKAVRDWVEDCKKKDSDKSFTVEFEV